MVIVGMGIRIVRPTHRGLVERLGKYNRYAGPGLHVIIPGIEKMYKVDVREVLVEAQQQVIITNDNLNAEGRCAGLLQGQGRRGECQGVAVQRHELPNQIVELAETTLRNIIGTLTLKSANSERGKINQELSNSSPSRRRTGVSRSCARSSRRSSRLWTVQEMMNSVVGQQREDRRADFATATETKADGSGARPSKGGGEKRATILAAEGEAQAIALVNEAADKYFVGNAQTLRRLETVEKAFWQNAKIVVPADGQLVNIIGDLAGVAPLPLPQAPTTTPVRK